MLTVNANFQSGQLGIQLDDLSNFPTNTGPPTGPFVFVSVGDPDIEFIDPPEAEPSVLCGNRGDDLLTGNAFLETEFAA